MKTRVILTLLFFGLVLSGCTNTVTNVGGLPQGNTTVNNTVNNNINVSNNITVENASATLPTLDESPGMRIDEFSMTAFYNESGIWYSLKDMNVSKGDRVKIRITNTKGMHNFNIDEYDIHQDLPLNQEQTVEFVADRTGEFIYYCSYPGHREKGQWGILRVSG